MKLFQIFLVRCGLWSIEHHMNFLSWFWLERCMILRNVKHSEARLMSSLSVTDNADNDDAYRFNCTYSIISSDLRTENISRDRNVNEELTKRLFLTIRYASDHKLQCMVGNLLVSRTVLSEFFESCNRIFRFLKFQETFNGHGIECRYVVCFQVYLTSVPSEHEDSRCWSQSGHEILIYNHEVYSWMADGIAFPWICIQQGFCTVLQALTVCQIQCSAYPCETL